MILAINHTYRFPLACIFFKSEKHAQAFHSYALFLHPLPKFESPDQMSWWVGPLMRHWQPRWFCIVGQLLAVIKSDAWNASLIYWLSINLFTSSVPSFCLKLLRCLSRFELLFDIQVSTLSHEFADLKGHEIDKQLPAGIPVFSAISSLYFSGCSRIKRFASMAACK